MPKKWPNTYLNIFGCPRFDQTYIQIYLYAQDLTEQISKCIQTEEKPQIRICLLYASHFIRILIIQICVFLLKPIKTDSNWSYIVQIGQEWSAYGKNAHEMGPKKYLNIFECPILDQMNIRIYSDAEKFIKEIFKYIRIVEKPRIWIQIIFAGYFIQIF